MTNWSNEDFFADAVREQKKFLAVGGCLSILWTLFVIAAIAAAVVLVVNAVS